MKGERITELVDSSEYIVDKEKIGAQEIPSTLMGEGKGEGDRNSKLKTQNSKLCSKEHQSTRAPELS